MTAALAASLCACSSAGSEPQFAGGDVTLPGSSGGDRLPASSSPPEDLPGVDTSDLVSRERRQWWRLVSQLYAPCSEQAVSIAQCVKEARPCAACKPAAQLIAARVRSGATVAEAEAAYAARFGPNIKSADLTGSPSRGPENAPVTIVVWSDFQCPACKHAMPILDQVIEKHAADVRLVHKFYPLKKHPQAEVAAKAAAAALRQGRYWKMEKLLFDNQLALGESDLDRYARSLGIDMDRFHEDMVSEQTLSLIARDKAEADKAGLRGTPFILINGREFDAALFRLDLDLEPWIVLEVELSRGKSKAAVAAEPTKPAEPSNIPP
jgi:protein-disulfide isomerase